MLRSFFLSASWNSGIHFLLPTHVESTVYVLRVFLQRNSRKIMVWYTWWRRSEATNTTGPSCLSLCFVVWAVFIMYEVGQPAQFTTLLRCGTSSRRLYGRPIWSVDFLFTTPSSYCVPRLLSWCKLRTVLRNPPTLQNASEKHDHCFYFLLWTYSESGRSNSECSSFLKYKFMLH